VQRRAASATDLHAAVAARRFRDDLLYRLAVVPVTLPPLRARADFAQAARAVLAAIDRDAQLTDAAVQRLAAHPWPGNFRELRSLLTRLLLARPPGPGGTRLDAADVAELLPALAVDAAPDTVASGVALGAGASALQQAARARVLQEFERCGGNISRISRNLGISRTTVYRHLREPAPATGVPGTR
jgi:transcriptional regulator of acetoin/glycerol metabolism